MTCSGAGSATAPPKRILTQLQAQADATDLITWDVSVDSTVCRAHQHAAGQELLPATAGADGVVVDRHARLLFDLGLGHERRRDRHAHGQLSRR